MRNTESDSAATNASKAFSNKRQPWKQNRLYIIAKNKSNSGAREYIIASSYNYSFH